MSPANIPRTRTLVVSRVFNAPLDLVWRTWTDPELVMQWWGRTSSPARLRKWTYEKEVRRSFACVRRRNMVGKICSVLELPEIVPMTSLEFIQHMADKTAIS